MLKTAHGGNPGEGVGIYIFGLLRNSGDEPIFIKNNAITHKGNYLIEVRPNETKFINSQGISVGGLNEQESFQGIDSGGVVDVTFYGLTPVNVSKDPKIQEIMLLHGIKKDI